MLSVTCTTHFTYTWPVAFSAVEFNPIWPKGWHTGMYARGVSDLTCHSSWSRPASSPSSPAWWSLRNWARRRNSVAACPSPPHSAQSHSGWSSPSASYHCSTHTPWSLLLPDCTLRWTRGGELTSMTILCTQSAPILMNWNSIVDVQIFFTTMRNIFKQDFHHSYGI